MRRLCVGAAVARSRRCVPNDIMLANEYVFFVLFVPPLQCNQNECEYQRWPLSQFAKSLATKQNDRNYITLTTDIRLLHNNSDAHTCATDKHVYITFHTMIIYFISFSPFVPHLHARIRRNALLTLPLGAARSTRRAGVRA